MSEINTFVNKIGCDVLGLKFETNDTKENDIVDIPENVKKLAEDRWNAKLNKDWAKADLLRGQLADLGYIIIDSKEEYKIEKK
jgi:cysteinyl-tRNA synthetase